MLQTRTSLMNSELRNNLVICHPAGKDRKCTHTPHEGGSVHLKTLQVLLLMRASDHQSLNEVATFLHLIYFTEKTALTYCTLQRKMMWTSGSVNEKIIIMSQ